MPASFSSWRTGPSRTRGWVQRGRQGLLKVGTGAGGILPLASSVLQEFRSGFPDVEVEIHPGYVPQNLEALTRRTLDLAIVLVPFEPHESPHYLRLGTVEVMVAVLEGSRLAVLDRIPRSELLREPFLD